MGTSKEHKHHSHRRTSSSKHSHSDSTTKSKKKHHHHHHHHHKKSSHHRKNKSIELSLDDKVLQNALDCLEEGALSAIQDDTQDKAQDKTKEMLVKSEQNNTDSSKSSGNDNDDSGDGTKIGGGGGGGGGGTSISGGGGTSGGGGSGTSISGGGGTSGGGGSGISVGGGDGTSVNNGGDTSVDGECGSGGGDRDSGDGDGDSGDKDISDPDQGKPGRVKTNFSKKKERGGGEELKNGTDMEDEGREGGGDSNSAKRVTAERVLEKEEEVKLKDFSLSVVFDATRRSGGAAVEEKKTPNNAQLGSSPKGPCNNDGAKPDADQSHSSSTAKEEEEGVEEDSPFQFAKIINRDKAEIKINIKKSLEPVKSEKENGKDNKSGGSGDGARETKDKGSKSKEHGGDGGRGERRRGSRRSRSRSVSKERSSRKRRRGSRSRSRSRHRSSSYSKYNRSRHRSRSRSKSSRSRYRSRHGYRSRYRSHSRSGGRRDQYRSRRSSSRSDSRSKYRHRSRSGSRRSSLPAKSKSKDKVVKSEANKNVVENTENKSLTSLTDFCKNLQKNQEMENSGIIVEEPVQTYRAPFVMNEYPIYHPYHEPWTSSSKIITQSSLLAIADRPANVPPLTNQPATVQSTANHLTALPGPPLAIDQPAVSLPLTDRFPVSTGLEHKSSDQKKEETVNIFGSQESINIADIAVRRVQAAQRLKQNPSDFEAINTLVDIERKTKIWAESKVTPGKFTGQQKLLGLSKIDHQTGIQAWAKKNMFHQLTPVRGGFGLRMMKKMGWNEGSALGKEGVGCLEPIAIDVKVNRQGLCAKTDKMPSSSKKVPTLSMMKPPGANLGVTAPLLKAVDAKTSHLVEGKHPVSVLQEICSKKHWDNPTYTLIDSGGPAHSMTFVYQVTIPMGTFRAASASKNKKQAKMEAATAALQGLGMLERKS